MNNLMSRFLGFIEQQEKFFFRTFIVVLIIFLFLAAERFQNLVLFVSLGLLGGALHARWQDREENPIEIGAFVGACIGFLIFAGYFLISGIISLF